MPSSPPKVVKDPLTGIRAPTPRGKRNGSEPLVRRNGRRKPVDQVVREARGIILDVGCGDEESKYPGAVGMDKQNLAGVDVVHDWNEFPWPFEDESVLTMIASHVVEHVDPTNGHFIDWMNEAWRVLRVGGQMALVTPYAGSAYYWQDPTHCNGCTERTFWYFAPHHPSRYHVFYRPAPWLIQQCDFSIEGMLEVTLKKLADDPEYHILGVHDIPVAGTGA